jgi:hypothetical protein
LLSVLRFAAQANLNARRVWAAADPQIIIQNVAQHFDHPGIAEIPRSRITRAADVTAPTFPGLRNKASARITAKNTAWTTIEPSCSPQDTRRKKTAAGGPGGVLMVTLGCGHVSRKQH